MSKSVHSLMNQCDAIDLANHIKQGDISAAEVLKASIERLEAVNPELNAVAERLYDTAAQAPTTDGPFEGVPTLIKDMFSPVKEARTTNGSNALGEARPGLDDAVVSRLRASGCRFIGTTTAPEFGISYTTESARFGATRNPWNTDHSAGGSSGGAAALVAARVLPFAHGNDGGGSIRVPSSCCGVFGLKPSRGLVPSGPLVGEGWGGMTTTHAITLSVRDSAALLDVVAGSDLGAPYAAPIAKQGYLSSLATPVRKLRIAVVEDAGPFALSNDAKANVLHTAKLCESLGHDIEMVKFPIVLMPFFDAVYNIIAPNTKSYLSMLGDMRGAPVNNEELEATVRILLREKGDISAVQYTQAIEHIHRMGREMAQFLTEYDVLLTSTLAHQPPQIGDIHVTDDSLSLDDFTQLSHGYSPYTAVFNATGQPAMSVPLYWTAKGLPMGAHFVGRFGDEVTLLQLAAQLEAAQPWKSHIPSVNACL